MVDEYGFEVHKEILTDKEIMSRERNVNSAKCNVCGFVPTNSNKKPSSAQMRSHHFAHLARDFKIFRYVCRSPECTFVNSQSGDQSRHRRAFVGHRVEDRLLLVEKYCGKFIDTKSPSEYQAEVKNAAFSGTAFGEDLTSVSSTPFWLEGRKQEKLQQKFGHILATGDDGGQLPASRPESGELDIYRCNVCGMIPIAKRGKSALRMRNHHYIHLARDFRIFRYVCCTIGCGYKSSHHSDHCRHRIRHRDHEIEDRAIVVERACRRFIDHKSIDDYQRELQKAAVTGVAFGENLAPLSATMYWLEDPVPKSKLKKRERSRRRKSKMSTLSSDDERNASAIGFDAHLTTDSNDSLDESTTCTLNQSDEIINNR